MNPTPTPHRPARCVILALAILALALSGAPPAQASTNLFTESFESALSANWFQVYDADTQGTPAYWAPWDKTNAIMGTHVAFSAGVGGFLSPYPIAVGRWLVPSYSHAIMARYLDLARHGSAKLRFAYKQPSYLDGGGTGLLLVRMMGVSVWSNRILQNNWRWVDVDLSPWCGSTLGPALSVEYIGKSGIDEGAYLEWLTIDADPPAADAYEPDGTASRFRTLTNGVPQLRSLHTPYDVDWVSFTLDGSQNQRVAIQATGRGPTEMQLFQGDGARIALAQGTDGVPTSNRIAATVAPGIFYLRIAPAEDNVAPDYELLATWSTADLGTGWDDGYQSLGGGWRRLEWFGDYVPMGDDGWIWHSRHGFLFVAENSAPGSVWLFAQDMGWLWTHSDTYPFLFRQSDAAWLWYNGSVAPRWFRNMATGAWESWP
jgi:hypothetical protein